MLRVKKPFKFFVLFFGLFFLYFIIIGQRSEYVQNKTNFDIEEQPILIQAENDSRFVSVSYVLVSTVIF